MKLRIIYIVIGVLIVVVYSGILPMDIALPKCPINYVSGLFCAGCGTQRAIIALFEGNILDAFHSNVLLFPALALATFMSVTKKKPWALHKNNKFVIASLIFIVAYTIMRNLPYYPFTLLAP